MRVYLPASRAMLAELVASGRLSGPLHGCAATEALAKWFDHQAGDDDEPLEFAAQSRAADLSLGLIDGDQPPRRAVLAVEANARPAPDVDDLVGVSIDDGVALTMVRALFVDDDAAGPAVVEALEALAALADDDPTIPDAVERLDEHDLVWFAPEELAGWLSRG